MTTAARSTVSSPQIQVRSSAVAPEARVVARTTDSLPRTEPGSCPLRETTTIGVRAGPYASARTVPAPTRSTSAARRIAAKPWWSASELIVPDNPSEPLAAPSRVATKFSRSRGPGEA